LSGGLTPAVLPTAQLQNHIALENKSSREAGPVHLRALRFRAL
jgi:hypothetical protein